MEIHCLSLLHNTSSHLFLCRREHDCVAWIAHSVLRNQISHSIRQEQGAVTYAPGGKHIDHSAREDVELMQQAFFTIGDTYQVEEDVPYSLPSGSFFSSEPPL